MIRSEPIVCHTLDPFLSSGNCHLLLPGKRRVGIAEYCTKEDVQNERCHRYHGASMHYGEYLDTQRADIALLYWSDPPERFQSETLFHENWVDDALAEQGRSRHVGYAMPTYGPAPLILETTDLILTCPESIGREFNERTGMLMSKCPLETPSIVKDIHMVWHTRLGNHPAHGWLRDRFREVSAAITN